MTDDPTDAGGGTADDDAYGGLLGAFPYAFRSSDSLAFKSYVVVGGFLAFAIAFLFGLALVALIGASAGVGGGSFSFSRAFFVLVGLLVVAPLLAPVLFVARRHRRATSSAGYDARLAALGYLFLGSLYVALVISTPEAQQTALAGGLGTVTLFAGTAIELAVSLDPLSVAVVPLVRFLYGLPRFAGLVPPLAVAALVWLAGRSA